MAAKNSPEHASRHRTAGAQRRFRAGAVLGGFLGWLVGVGSLAIPGVGPFIAAGPILTALAGAGLGGAVGGLTGALAGMGIPEYEAKRYQGRLSEGGILLSVHCDTSEEIDRAKKLLQRTGAEDISATSESSTKEGDRWANCFFGTSVDKQLLEIVPVTWQPNDQRLLFATRNGTPWDQNMILKWQFKPLLKTLGIKLPRGDGFYILRHGNATLMSSFGAPQKLRQQRLGHTDGSPITESVYTHVISEDGKRVAGQLGTGVWGVLDASWTGKKNGSEGASSKPFRIN